jgi:hypothetical protein
MNEIAPGIFHWTATHPDIKMRVSSYYAAPAGIVIDPLEPEDGMGFFDELDTPPQQVVLTSGLHWRHSDRFRDRYGATIRVVEQGIERWGADTDRQAEASTSETRSRPASARTRSAASPPTTPR